MIGNLTKLSWSFLISCIAAVYVLVMLLVRFRAYRKRKRSVDWPMIGGTFQSGSIEPIRGGYAGEGVNFRLKVEYSYAVQDSAYSGKYTREFLTEDEAISLQRSLKQGPLYVRYNPVSPADCVLDPYRDVWQPTGPAAASSIAPLSLPVRVVESGAAEVQMQRIANNYWWTAPVSLGKLLLFQIFLAAVIVADSKPNIGFFWFIAGIYFVSAITTKGCCWWAPTGKTLPTWVGRLALIAVASGWILASTCLAH
jgi:hypothetical protein